MSSTTTQRVQCFGKKKTATAVAQCKVSGGKRKAERSMALKDPVVLGLEDGKVVKRRHTW